MRMWINRKVVFVFCACVFYVFALPADADGKNERAKPHEDKLSDEEHFNPDGEHNAEFDREAFLGDRKDEFDHLSPEEAQRRLKILLKQVDTDADGHLTSEELKAWVKGVFKKKMVEGMESDIKEKDKDGDGFINWDEFLKDSYGEDVSAEDEEMKRMIDRDRKHYDVADADKDGKLTATEFGSFLHPESNPEMQALNAQETLEGKGLLTLFCHSRIAKTVKF
jgi:Ca2+-binding EF-hand superfamily protein